MRLDAHQHFWTFDAARDTWITDALTPIARDFMPDDLAPLLTSRYMDGCIAVEAAPSLDQTRFLLGLAEQHGFIKGVIGWADILAADVSAMLDQIAANAKLVGVRYGAQDLVPDFLAREDVAQGVRALARHDLVFDILIREHQLDAAITLVTRCPDVRFVLDHLGKPRIGDRVIEPWATRLRALAHRPNVACKVSGLVTEADWGTWRPADLAPYLDVAFDAFGAERLMFGSDWPVCVLAGSYGRVSTAIESYAGALSVDERAALFGETAARVYRISERD